MAPGPSRRPGVPHVNAAAFARLLHALAGGTFTDAESRALAKRIEDLYPGTGEQVRKAREFHAKTAAKDVSGGARGVIFAASGPPGSPVLHGLAGQANPGARFLYADPTPEITSLRRHLGGDGQVEAVSSRVREPGRLFAAAGHAGLEPPLSVHLILVAQFWPGDAMAELIAEYARLLRDLPAGGSTLALSLSQAPPGGRPADLTEHLGHVWRHGDGEVYRWLDDAGLKVLPPGLVPVTRWPMASQEPGWRIAGVTARVV